MQTIEQSREMAKLACEALADKKGEDIRVIDIAGISVLADYFIIANGTNESQVRALVDNVEEELAKAGYEAIIQSIASGDVASLKKMPGIGAKSASQIVLDLQGKLVPAETTSSKQSLSKYPKEILDAVEGLKNLGYKQSELSNCIHYMAENPGLSVEQYILSPCHTSYEIRYL